ncbi:MULTISPECIES: hypothetical protein [Streptomyces]|uniref:hypothetical protein n=1 Tax=Streptomyces TaxID=1883 RepID=UPI001319C8A7|nr:hypothetical protein [Streptomyces hokutonensis]
MNKQQAIDAAKQLGLSIGDEVTMQNDGQIIHSHTSRSNPYEHVDGWRVKRTGQDNWETEKIHGPV